MPMPMLALVALLALADPSGTPPKSTARPPDDGQQVICKTWAPVGSLIANHKECRTKHDWAEMRVNTMHQAQGGSCASAETGSCY